MFEEIRVSQMGLGIVRQDIETAIGVLVGVIAGAGGKHTTRALELLHEVAVQLDKAIVLNESN